MDNEGYTTCDQGHTHWGLGGAAGLMLHHQDPTSGTHRYLMQQRSPWVDHGGTWAPPSGALGVREDPVRGAVREAQEELGPFQSANHQIAHTNDHGGWAFHTVTADSPHMFEPELDDESQDAAWLTPEEIDELPLHPGFRESWNDLRPPTQQKKFASGENPYYHVAPTSVRDQFQQTGPQQFNPAENPAWGDFGGVQDQPGFYAWNTLPAAQTYRERLTEQRGGDPHDIWQVNVHPSWWDADPEFDGDRDAEREYGGQSLVYRGDKPLTDYYHHSGISGEVVPPPEDDTEEPESDEQGNPIIDHLTLSSVAHNLHYKSEQGPLTVQEAYQYAGQLLSMMGVKDPGAPGQALHAWLRLYPGDQQMSQGPAVHSIESAVSAPAVPALYHWIDAANLHQWMDPATTGPGSTYLTEHGNAPGDGWNPDVPQMANPVRLTIDHSQLDPNGWDEQYHGWLNNYLYHGVIPPEAVKGIKAFPAPDTWDMPEHWAKAAGWYHTAPASARDSIKEHGLDASKGNPLNPGIPQGTYLLNDPKEVAMYRGDSESHFGEPFDVWNVDADEYKPREDPTRPDYPAYYVPHPIPADRLTPFDPWMASTKFVPPLPETEGSTEPTEVMNPWDAWPEWGEQTNDQKTRDIQYGDSSTVTV